MAVPRVADLRGLALVLRGVWDALADVRVLAMFTEFEWFTFNSKITLLIEFNF